ncbi:hypothetical protein Tco_1376706 [Tanacetum coccineum]
MMKQDTKKQSWYLIWVLEGEYQARALLAKSKDSSRRSTQSLEVQKQLTKLNVTYVAQKDFEAKYNKVKAKLALLSSSASVSKDVSIKNKGLIAEAYEWMKKKCHQMTIRWWSGWNLQSCSTPLPPLKKLDGVEPISGSKTIKSILRSKSTFKAKTLKGVIINEPSLAPSKGNKSSSALKVNSAPAGKLKSVKIEDDNPLAIVMKELNNLKLQISKNQSSYSRNNQPQ